MNPIESYRNQTFGIEKQKIKKKVILCVLKF